ncbi:hypothetical protein Tco_0482558 [Tanacetum coccineum]
MLKTTGNSSKKDNLSMSNSFSALNEEEEDVENVYDESSNLIQNTKAGGSSSFTAAAGSGPEWLFDIDTLTKSMNYKPVVIGNQTNGNAGTKESIDAGQAGKKIVPSHEYILLPLWTPDSQALIPLVDPTP